MTKRDLHQIFIDEIYSKHPSRNYPTNKIIYNHIDEIWSIDLADMIDYKISNNKGYRYIFIVIDNFSKFLWAIPLKIKYSQTITNEFSNILTTSKRKPVKLESDRGSQFYNNIFQNFLKSKNIQHYSRFTDKGPSIAERVVRTVRNLLKKPVFERRKADWISELPLVIKQYNITIHHSIKMTPIPASKKSNKKLVNNNLKDSREAHKPKFKSGQLVVRLILNESSAKAIRQIGVISYTQLQKSYTTLFLVIELTIYPRDIIKTHYYLLNYLLNKTIKL